MRACEGDGRGGWGARSMGVRQRRKEEGEALGEMWSVRAQCLRPVTRASGGSMSLMWLAPAHVREAERGGWGYFSAVSPLRIPTAEALSAQQ